MAKKLHKIRHIEVRNFYPIKITKNATSPTFFNIFT